MASQIIFFRKNKADYSKSLVTATASEGDDFTDFPFDRRNDSAWVTSGSTDASATTFEVDFGETQDVSEIVLAKHNFKSFQIEYWDGAAYQPFSPAIAPTSNMEESNHFSVTSVATRKVRITINGTQTPNEDKFLYQFIITEAIGQLDGWPIIDKPKHSRNKKIDRMLSGKHNVIENLGGFSCTLAVKNWRDAADREIIENLYNANEGFLVWLCGGDEAQFSARTLGYRMEDLFLMRTSGDYEPELYEGLYQAGLDLKIPLVEVIE